MTRPALVACVALASLLAACQPAASDNDPSSVASNAGEPGTAVVASASATPATTQTDTAERMQAEAEADDACGASKVAPWIGKEATVPVRIEVAKASAAADDRWIYPDSVVTQDFSPDRLNVVMEKGTERILSARCG